MTRYAVLLAALLPACQVDGIEDSGVEGEELAYEEVYPDETPVVFAGDEGILTFDSESAFLAWAETSPMRDRIVERWTRLEEERAIVHAKGLYAIDDDSDDRVIEYVQDLRGRTPSYRVGPGILWDGLACGGALLHLTDIPAPSISANKRDRASSWCPTGVGSVTLFDNTWYRGASWWRAGVAGQMWNLLDGGFDNRTGSYF